MSDFIKQFQNIMAMRQVLPDHLWYFHSQLLHAPMINQHLRKAADLAANIRTVLNKPEWMAWADTLVALSRYGWYLIGDFTIAQFNEVSILLDEGNIEELDLRMMQIIQDNWNEITQTILHKHPCRRLPLEQAFWAHKNALYSLSIPVFFAQIDGLCDEGTGKKFFLNKRTDDDEYVPKIRDWALQENKTVFHRTMCAALLNKGAFQMHSSQPNRISFTRHSVLHGETSDYGTKINSLKAVSLLIYISETCFE